MERADALSGFAHTAALSIATVQDITQPVESLSGGQRQAVAVARAAMSGKRLVIMDVNLIKKIRDNGLPVILISHDLPAIFEVADRMHICRLGRRIGVVGPKQVSMSDTVAFITGASKIPSSENPCA